MSAKTLLLFILGLGGGCAVEDQHGSDGYHGDPCRRDTDCRGDLICEGRCTIPQNAGGGGGHTPGSGSESGDGDATLIYLKEGKITGWQDE